LSIICNAFRTRHAENRNKEEASRGTLGVEA
jgi:hypothetical protein